jgi:hypothetical protein
MKNAHPRSTISFRKTDGWPNLKCCSLGFLPIDFVLTKTGAPSVPGAQATTHKYHGWKVLHGDWVKCSVASGSDGLVLILIGDVDDANHPYRNTDEVLNALASDANYESVLAHSLRLTGEVAFIAIQGNCFQIWNDACAQLEVFYAENLSDTFASTPRLLVERAAVRIGLSPLEKADAQSPLELRIGHLAANHCLSSASPSPVLYFPTAALQVKPIELDEAVQRLVHYLQGIFRALQHRDKLAMPITAGYDSRLLLAAYKPQQGDICYLYRHPGMSAAHHDVVIGGKLAQAKGVYRRLLSYETSLSPADTMQFEQMHEPRFAQAPRLFNGDKVHFGKHVVVNGNIGEIGRSYFGDMENPGPEVIAKLLGNKGNVNKTKALADWLESLDQQYLGRHNLLDLLYWEERMGLWAAKAKTEYRLVTDVISP